MESFLQNTTLIGIDMVSMLRPNPSKRITAHKSQLKRLVIDGIASGAVKPLHRTVFDRDRAEEAFRLMATGKHIGKVVIKIRDEEQQKLIAPQRLIVRAVPRIVFYPNKSYVVCGGFGDFGLELAHWLVGRGVRRLVLCSRMGPRDAYDQWSIEKIRSIGVNVVVSTADASTPEGATKLVKQGLEWGAVGGIFNADMAVISEKDSAVLSEHTPGLTATLNLDGVSRQLCPELDFFVAFSAEIDGRDPTPATNCGSAYSAMHRLCQQRRNDGLQGLAIRLATDVDVVSMVRPIQSCLQMLDRLLNSDKSVAFDLI